MAYKQSLILAASCALILTACGKPENPSASTGTSVPGDAAVIKIGTSNPLTGPQAHLGKDNENGARMAVDDANAKGVSIGGKPVRFELLSEDDQADPRIATIVAQKLVDAKAAGVIGHMNSGTSIPASRIYHDNGIAQISPSATAIGYTAQGFNTAFRVMTNDSQQGRALGEFAAKTLKAKTIAVIDDRTAYGQGLADEFVKAAEAAGATIVTREYTNDHAVDFTAVLTSIKSKKPDLVFFGGMDPQGAPMAKQLKGLELNAKFMMGDGGYTPNFIANAGAAAEGVYASMPGVPLDKMPGGQAFTRRYEERFKQPVQLYAPYSYDAVNTLIAAMQKAGSSDPAKYLAELPKTAYDGVTAKIAFDGKGDLSGGSVTLYQVTQGKWQPLQTLGGGAPAAAH